MKLRVRIEAVLFAMLAIASPRVASAGLQCSFTSIVPVSFGAYTVFAPNPVDAVGSLTYRCTGAGPGDSVIIHLSRGASTTWRARHLAAGGYVLAYELFLDAARSVVWGDGTSGTSQYGPVAPPVESVTVPIYGRIPPRQNVGAGIYSDTIVVTMLF